MNCQYCGAVNPEGEHRCLRCGRLLGAGFQPRAPRGSAAPEAVPQFLRTPQVITLPNRDMAPPRVPQQQPLFHVIPLDMIAPPPKPKEGGTRSPVARQAALRMSHPDQGYLLFDAAAAAAIPALRPTIECDAPVASIRSRCRAAALDLLIVLAGECLFAGCFFVWVGQPPSGRTAWLVYGIAFALILAFYRVMVYLLSDRSPGMRFAGLRLLHFHGRSPRRRQRLLREAASVLSLLPVGIGFFYALADEEHLTFHDHISGTFPTPDTPEASARGRPTPERGTGKAPG